MTASRTRTRVRDFTLGAVFTLSLLTGCASPPTTTPAPVLTVYQGSVAIGDPHHGHDLVPVSRVDEGAGLMGIG